MSDAEDTIIEERLYTVSFSKPVYGRKVPRRKRTPRAIRYLKDFVKKHLKADMVIIDPEVNEYCWARGIQNPPRKIKIRAVKTEDEIVEVFLA